MPRYAHRSFTGASYLFLMLGTIGAGCGSARPKDDPTPTIDSPAPLARPETQPVSALTDPTWVEPVRATCPPPTGWAAEPLKTTNLSKHQVWISPTGTTAYGVLNARHVLMPLATDERILGEFVDGMRDTEGSADLLEKRVDKDLANGVGGMRFVARGRRHTVRANLVSRGRHAWIWYAGTLTGRPVDGTELRTAERAREQTVVEPAGRP